MMRCENTELSDTLDSFMADVNNPPVSSLPGAISFWEKAEGDLRTVCDAVFPYIFGTMNVTWPTRHASLIICIPVPFTSALVGDGDEERSTLLSHIGFVHHVKTFRDLNFVSLQGTVHRIVYENENIVNVGGHGVYKSEYFNGGCVFYIAGTLPAFVSAPNKNAEGDLIGFQAKVLPRSVDRKNHHVSMTIHTSDAIYSLPLRKVSDKAWKIRLSKILGPQTRFFIHLCDSSTKLCIASHEFNVRYIPMEDCVRTPIMNDSRLIIPESTLRLSLTQMLNRVRDLNSFLDFNRMTNAGRFYLSKSICENVRANGWTTVHFFAALRCSDATMSQFLTKLGRFVNIRHIDNEFCTPLMISMRYDNPMCFTRLFHLESKIHPSYKKMWLIVEKKVFSS